MMLRTSVFGYFIISSLRTPQMSSKFTAKASLELKVSSVMFTEPSSEFSTGTSAPVACPSSTAESA